MKKIFLPICVAVGAILGANAEALSPEAALARVGNDGKTPAKVRALTARTPELKSTFTMADGAPAVYLFEKNDAWMVVSADTRAAALLGYGEGINNGEIPPAMQYWLDFYAREMASVPDVAYVAAPASRAERANIDPMLKTIWDQESPYNNQCPLLGGRRALTGCVATALAQVVNYHRWPEKGVGQLSYQYQYNGNTYQESFNFGNTTFDYDNMRDNYLGSYTAEQATAVATLMKACGVASEMEYSPYSSGASDMWAAAGMVQYMNYSVGMVYQQRDWFYTTEWDELIYNQLAEGMPLPYGGATAQNEGHEFVCDGYKDGYFHFNWGWSGLSDGYFLLSSLSPSTQGAGGASSNLAFNYSQSVLTNMRAPKAGDKVVPQIWADSFKTNNTTYNRKAGATVTVKGGFNSVCIQTMSSLTVGFQCVDVNDENNVVYCGLAGLAELPSGYRFEGYGVSSKSVPVGTWKVLPAFKYDGEWYAMRYNPKNQAPLIFTVTEDRITVTEGTPVPDPEVLSLFSTFKGWSESELVIGQVSKFTFDITASKDVKLTFQPLLLDANSILKARATAQELSLTANETTAVDFSIKFPTSLVTSSTYYLVNAYVDTETSSFVAISEPVAVKLVAQAGIGTVEADGNTVVGYYDLQGRAVLNPTTGLYLQKMSDGSVKRVYIR